MKLKKPVVWMPLCFLLLNALGLWQGLAIWEKHLQLGVGGPRLLQSPADVERLAGRQVLAWVWDQPVVSETQLGVWTEDAPVQFDPPVAGVFSWRSDRQLEFVPMQDWPAAQGIHMDLQIRVSPVPGRLFLLQQQATVLGPALDVLSMEPYVDVDRHEIQLRLRLNAAVNRADLQKHLQLLDDGDNALAFSVDETPNADEFLITASRWTNTGALRLLVQNGLSSVFGPEGGMAQDRVFKIRPPESFALMGLEVNQPTFGGAEVELTFSEVPDLKTVMNGLRIEPEVKFSVGTGRWWRQQSCQVSGEFVPGQKYRLIFSEGIRSQQGNVMKELVEREIIIPQREPGLRFAHEGWILNARGANLIRLETENEGAVEASLKRIHLNNLVELAVRASGRDTWYYEQHPDRNLGEEIWLAKMESPAGGDFDLDLSAPLAKAGQGVYRLAVKGRNSHKSIERLVVRSDVGLMLRQYGDRYVVWALQLDTAEPVSGLEVSLWSETRQLLAKGTTDAQGLVELPKTEELPLVVIAQGGQSLGMLTLDHPRPLPGENGERPYLQDGNEAFVYSSRGMYRPDETVNARAIVRGKHFALPGEFPVEWRLQNPAGMTVWKKQVTLSAVGTAEAEIKLNPEWANGRYRLRVSLPGDDAPVWGETMLHVESFVPPQVVVKASTPDGEVGVPGRFTVNVDAQMLYGAPAAAHTAKAILTLEAETFRSSEYPDYHFSDGRKAGFGSWSRPVGEGQTDAAGQCRFQIQVPDDKLGPSALRAVVGISVKEFSGREAVTFVSRRVDRVPYYVGLKSTVLSNGELRVDLLGVRPDGSRIQESPDLEMAWYRLNWQSGYRRDAQGRYTYFSEEIAIQEGLEKIALEAGQQQKTLSLTPDAVYRVAVRDPATGFSASQKIYLGNGSDAPERADQMVLTLDKESYQEGEEAVVTLKSPFDGRVLLSVESEVLLLKESIMLTNGEGSFRFKVPASGAPNLWVLATVLRPQPDGGAAPVMRSEGAIPLRLQSGALDQPLRIEVAAQLRPSQDVEINLKGRPGAEVVLTGVDEGILLLSQFETPDPLRWILALRRVLSQSWDSFDDLLPELGRSIFAGDAKTGGGVASALRKRLNPVDAKRFAPLTWWSGVRTIPESGTLNLTMPMPEFSGTVRWMAVQVSATGMGSAEAFSRVGRELVVQQSLPLFLAPGDESFWNIRLHNRSATPRTLTLLPSAKGPLQIENTGEVLTLAAGEVRQISLKVKAGQASGKAVCTLGVKAGEDFWQERLELAVRPLAAYEQRMQSWLLMPGQSLKIPVGTDMFPGTGERGLGGSSMPVMQLEASRQYLLRYPYGCVEQTVSAAYLGLVMPDWSADAAGGAKVQVEAGIMALWKKQRPDGSFGYWHGRDQVSVPGSFTALGFLLEAKAQGYDVNKRALTAGLEWTRQWLLGQQWRSDGRWENLSMVQACRVLALAGELDAGWVQRLRERREDLNGYSRVLAAECMLLSGQRPMAMEMLAGLTRVDEGDGWHSGSSGNAELMRILMQIDPRDGRIQPLVKGLLAERNAAGRWATTYENAAVIRAFAAYAKTYPQTGSAMKLQWKTADGATQFLSDGKAMALGEVDQGELINQGDAPLYVALQSGGIPLEATAVENQFKVSRHLMRLDGRELLQGEALQSGELLLMRFRISGLPRRSETMVVDQGLPAGLEALPVSQQGKAWKRLQVPQPEKGVTPRHLEVRDDRVMIFSAMLNQEQQIFDVLVRAVSPGTHSFPATQVQDMYDEALIFRGEQSLLKVLP